MASGVHLSASRLPLAPQPVTPGGGGNVSPLSGKAGQIFEELERRFARGRYKFGEAISAQELSTEFAVSRQPITVALNQLRAAGYVIVTAQVGCRVASPSPAEIRDFFRLYGRMEGTMAALAAERHETPEIRLLEELCRRIEAATVPAVGLPEQYAELVGAWHATIRMLARSPTLDWRLASFWRMADFLLWNGAPNLSPERIAVANDERRVITDALAARDGERAEVLMYGHVRGKPVRVGIVTDEQSRRTDR